MSSLVGWFSPVWYKVVYCEGYLRTRRTWPDCILLWSITLSCLLLIKWFSGSNLVSGGLQSCNTCYFPISPLCLLRSECGQLDGLLSLEDKETYTWLWGANSSCLGNILWVFAFFSYLFHFLECMLLMLSYSIRSPFQIKVFKTTILNIYVSCLNW